MIDQIRSEYRKVRSTRSALGLLVGLLALSGLAIWGTMESASPQEIGTALSSPLVLAAVAVVVPVFVLVLGIRSFTDEVRHGSVVPTFLATPVRTRVLGAKLAVIAAVSAVFALAALAAATGIVAGYLSANGFAVSLDAGAFAALVGRVVLVSVLWSALGVGIGALVRHQVAAIVGALAWVMLAENIVSGLAPEVARFLPGRAAAAAVGMTNDPTLLSTTTGAIVLAAWAAAAVALAAGALVRRDVA